MKYQTLNSKEYLAIKKDLSWGEKKKKSNNNNKKGLHSLNLPFTLGKLSKHFVGC